MFAASPDLAHHHKAGWYSKNPPKLWHYSVAYFEEDHRRRVDQYAQPNEKGPLDWTTLLSEDIGARIEPTFSGVRALYSAGITGQTGRGS
jgi:hypothetical protein